MYYSRTARVCYFSLASVLTSTASALLVPKPCAGICSTLSAALNRRAISAWGGRALPGRSPSLVTRTMSTEATVDVAMNLKEVEERIALASQKTGNNQNVRLVAVSKTKPMELLEAAYDAGCRCFGENYVQEMVEKAETWKDRTDVKWHFIGALQSNKCKTLVSCVEDVSRLTIETVSSTKLANKLENAVQNLAENNDKKRLKVYVQVNTSGEESKSGIQPGLACTDLCRHIVQECPGLELCGLMTIGAIGDLSCFDTLRQSRDEVVAALEDVSALELSMGMSGDFEQAIAAGATNVRVGSTIFGARDYSTKE